MHVLKSRAFFAFCGNLAGALYRRIDTTIRRPTALGGARALFPANTPGPLRSGACRTLQTFGVRENFWDLPKFWGKIFPEGNKIPGKFALRQNFRVHSTLSQLHIQTEMKPIALSHADSPKCRNFLHDCCVFAIRYKPEPLRTCTAKWRGNALSGPAKCVDRNRL